MFAKFLPSEYVLRYKKGKLVREGIGLSFFYWTKSTSACAIPVSNTDTDFIFEETTRDFQTVSIQGQLSYRILDYKKIAGAMDFTVDLKTKKYNNEPMAKLSKRIVNIAAVLIRSHIGSGTLKEAMQSGRSLAALVLEEMQNVPEIRDLGIAVTGFSLLKISANKETARALEAETREDILKQSDDALYLRRNASIEQERRIRENELARIEAESAAAREQLRLDNEIELERKRRELAELRLENARKDADAEAYRISAVMEAYGKLGAEVLVALATLNMEPEKMIAQAFDKLAANSEKIGTLNITPDLLESLKAG